MGQVRGYLPNRWPAWFDPHLIDFAPQSFGTFPSSYSLTLAGDVVIVPTMGHTAGHLSVIVKDGTQSIFLAGDASYTQQLLLDGVVDGVAGNDAVVQMTMEGIQRFLISTPTVYLPSHDLEAATRLMNRSVVLVPSTINSLSDWK